MMETDKTPKPAEAMPDGSNNKSIAAGPVEPKPPHGRLFYAVIGVILLLLTIGGIYWLFRSPSKPRVNPTTASQSKTVAPANQASLQPLQLVETKAYGDKYADGILPVGDGKYVTDAAKQGYVYACQGYAQNMQASQGGAGRRGPWFIGTSQYDLNKKVAVKGSVMWQAQFSNQVSGGNRTIISNDLPNHPTGVFPISPTDPAYAYDRNPNSIKGQTFTYSLSSSPVYGSPSCIGGQVGVMLSGVALFSGFDAAGRDAGAWEIQDSCQGHPQKDGIYHYHTLSSCIKDISAKTVIGFALDGFPITGPQVGTNNILTSNDLDVCHGITSQVVLDGKTVTTYHYVMTQDFPYSVSCYRAKPIQPPGQATPQ